MWFKETKVREHRAGVSLQLVSDEVVIVANKFKPPKEESKPCNIQKRAAAKSSPLFLPEDPHCALHCIL